MTKTIDFYFDFISPYTYIGHKRIEKEGMGINFNYKPILLGGLHKLWNITPQAYIEPKKQFMIMDCEMVSKKFKIDFIFNSKFPLNTIKLMRGCLILENDQLKKYIQLVFDAYWKNNEDITSNKVLIKILTQIGINLEEFSKKIDKNEIKEKLKNFTHDAFKKIYLEHPLMLLIIKIFGDKIDLIMLLRNSILFFNFKI